MILRRSTFVERTEWQISDKQGETLSLYPSGSLIVDPLLDGQGRVVFGAEGDRTRSGLDLSGTERSAGEPDGSGHQKEKKRERTHLRNNNRGDRSTTGQGPRWADGQEEVMSGGGGR